MRDGGPKAIPVGGPAGPTTVSKASALQDVIAGMKAVLTAPDLVSARAAFGLAIGASVQAWSATLDALAGLTTTAFGRALLTQADAPTALGTLGAAPASRQIGTASVGGLTGGGALGADLALAIAANGVTNAMLAQVPTLTLKANLLGSTAAVTDVTLLQLLDAALGNTRGATLYRGASGWAALAPGSSGYALTSNGAGADPSYQAITTATPTYSPVRQTVQSGPAASGAPSFLPASTSATLALAFQNVSATSPLVLTCAKGFGAAGAIDAIATFTANPSVTLPASQAYVGIYYDLDAAAWGSTILQPIWQAGGTISTVNGQFTFDYLAMQGWVGNGSGAAKANRVFVGEAVTSASAVTATTAYAYNGLYDSGFTATLPANQALVTRSSNLGIPPTVPRVTEMIFLCTTTDNNYVPGDVIGRAVAYQASGGGPTPAQPILGRNTVRYIGGTNGWVAYSLSTGMIFTLTNASWSYKIVDRRAV